MMKVAVVTGGGKGIGAGIGRSLQQAGYRVVIAEKDASLKKNLNNDFVFIQTDVKSEESVQRVIRYTIQKFGRIDVLVNNAAIIVKEKRIPVEKLSLKEWHESLDVNLTGCFLCSKYAIPFLRKVKGSIINISSTRAFQSEPNTEAYSATKGGILALTHALAISLGPEIRVNCISPGWIHTDSKEKLRKKDHLQHPVGRVGEIEDVAQLVVFLVSDETQFITGQNFIVDGGMTHKMVYAG